MTRNEIMWLLTFLERTVARGETETAMVIRLHSILSERLRLTCRTQVTEATLPSGKI